MKTERLAKLTNLRSCVRRNVNEAYVYRRYIQSGVNCVIFLVLVFTTVRFHSAMIGNVSFSLWAAQGHLLRPHVASIQINDRNVYSLVIYTSSLHCDIFFFFFIKKQETGPTQVRYSIIHQISHAFLYAYGLRIT